MNEKLTNRSLTEAERSQHIYEKVKFKASTFNNYQFCETTWLNYFNKIVTKGNSFFWMWISPNAELAFPLPYHLLTSVLHCQQKCYSTAGSLQNNCSKLLAKSNSLSSIGDLYIMCLVCALINKRSRNNQNLSREDNLQEHEDNVEIISSLVTLCNDKLISAAFHLSLLFHQKNHLLCSDYCS